MLTSRLKSSSAAAQGIQYVGGYVLGFVGQTTNRTVTLTSLTGGIASAPSANDLVIVYFATGSTVDRDLVVSGYTEVDELFRSDTEATNLVIAYKFMSSPADTSFVLTGGTLSADDAGAVAVQVWRNVDQIAPFDVFQQTTTTANTVRCNPPAITPKTSGAFIVSGGGGAHADGSRTFSSSNLTGFISAGGNDTNDVTIGLGYYEWTSGSFDPAQFTFSGTDSSLYSNASATLALRPNQDGTSPPTFIASAQTNNTTSSTSLVITKPTGTTEGDLMVAFMAADNSTTWTGDTGWTEVAERTANFGFRVAYKVAGASEGASYTFTAGTSRLLAGAIVTYRNAAYDAIGSITSSAEGTVTPTGPTAATTFSRLLGFAASFDGAIPTSSNMPIIVTDANSSNSPNWIVCDEIVPSGATGTRSFSSLESEMSAVLLTIKPA